MLPVVGVGFQNALGALAPPELAVHLEWAGRIRLNGAVCGQLRAVASCTDPEKVPDWLIVGFTLRVIPDHMDTGHQPDETALHVEGCADVAPAELLEAWARHTLHWISRWEDEGNRPIHVEWSGLLHGQGEQTEIAGKSGKFLGVDESFGLLLRETSGTSLVPLTVLLEEAR